MTASAKGRLYHYDLMQRNREIIQEQAAVLNRTIRTLREVTRTMPPTAVEWCDGSAREDLCIPKFGEIDQRLKFALEATEAEAAAPAKRKYA
jgi:hypothetical protein